MTVINYEYDVGKTTDVRHELLAYECAMQERLRKAQATVDAIQTLIQRAKERRIDLEIQSIN